MAKRGRKPKSGSSPKAGIGGSTRAAARASVSKSASGALSASVSVSGKNPRKGPSIADLREQRTQTAPGSPRSARQTRDAERDVEQFEHKEAKRANNPQVGLINADNDPDKACAKKGYAYDPHLDPQLQWAGKTEHTSFEVPSVSLHVHERIDPMRIIQAVKRKQSAPKQSLLFESPRENPPLREALDFYKHSHGWSNRLIAGDSLLVMNSLLEKEGLGGQVQMVYIDPPYGIKYGSNFQPFVNKRDVKDRKDEDLTQEPEMIRAFRDTWELGIHSYLTYLRDRLLLARDLLAESGSCFVQISDENVHHVRELMDEVFGAENFVAQINFIKTGGATSKFIASISDMIVWYARKKDRATYRQLYEEKILAETDYDFLEIMDGYRRLTSEEKRELPPHLVNSVFGLHSLKSAGYREATTAPFEFDGEVFHPGETYNWKTTVEGLRKLAWANRIQKVGNTLRYRRFISDLPVNPLTNQWSGGGAPDMIYVVQTSERPITRCMLMTTDPGDLVFDPTCGSGTTAYVAENWGRRWITCDSSRVAVALAKQRLMTKTFDYFELARPEQGVGSGFIYKTVPHVMLKSIAYNPDIKPGMSRAQIDAAIARHADQETLYDQPKVERAKVRVTGPFTVEAVPAPGAISPAQLSGSKRLANVDGNTTLPGMEDPEGKNRIGFTEPGTSVARSGETLRQQEWRDELLKCGVRAKGGATIHFSRIEPMAGTRWLHADAETRVNGANGNPSSKPKTGKLDARHREQGGGGEAQRVVVSFGPEHAPLEQRQVERALDEARKLHPKPAMLLFVAFQFDPEAAKDIDELTPEKTGLQLLKVQMNTDLLTDDLKKRRSSNESFWLVGQPDVLVKEILRGEHAGRYIAEVAGFDYYDPRTGKVESGGPDKIAMWMLDTDYDGRSIYPRQVFFPMAGKGEGWDKLARTLHAEIDDGLIEAFRGTVSLPFELGPNKTVAVKIVDDRGIESLRVMEVGEVWRKT